MQNTLPDLSIGKHDEKNWLYEFGPLLKTYPSKEKAYQITEKVFNTIVPHIQSDSKLEYLQGLVGTIYVDKSSFLNIISQFNFTARLQKKILHLAYQPTQEKALNIKELSRLKKGRFIAVLGGSGHGKSTLLNLLGGLDQADSSSLGSRFFQPKVTTFSILRFQPTSSRIYNFLDHPKELDTARKKHISFIFQRSHELKYFNGFENVSLGLSILGIGSQKRKAIAYALLKSIGLADHLYKPTGLLSGGQISRVATLRGIAKNANVLLADEPAGNLDSQLGNTMMALLKDWQRQDASERTVIMVTHHVEHAWEYADEVLYLHQGEIVYRYEKPQTLSSIDEFKKQLLEAAQKSAQKESSRLSTTTEKEREEILSHLKTHESSSDQSKNFQRLKFAFSYAWKDLFPGVWHKGTIPTYLTLISMLVLFAASFILGDLKIWGTTLNQNLTDDPFIRKLEIQNLNGFDQQITTRQGNIDLLSRLENIRLEDLIDNQKQRLKKEELELQRLYSKDLYQITDQSIFEYKKKLLALPLLRVAESFYLQTIVGKKDFIQKIEARLKAPLSTAEKTTLLRYAQDLNVQQAINKQQKTIEQIGRIITQLINFDLGGESNILVVTSENLEQWRVLYPDLSPQLTFLQNAVFLSLNDLQNTLQQQITISNKNEEIQFLKLQSSLNKQTFNASKKLLSIHPWTQLEPLFQDKHGEDVYNTLDFAGRAVDYKDPILKKVLFLGNRKPFLSNKDEGIYVSQDFMQKLDYDINEIKSVYWKYAEVDETVPVPVWGIVIENMPRRTNFFIPRKFATVLELQQWSPFPRYSSVLLDLSLEHLSEEILQEVKSFGIKVTPFREHTSLWTYENPSNSETVSDWNVKLQFFFEEYIQSKFEKLYSESGYSTEFQGSIGGTFQKLYDLLKDDVSAMEQIKQSLQLSDDDILNVENLIKVLEKQWFPLTPVQDSLYTPKTGVTETINRHASLFVGHQILVGPITDYIESEINKTPSWNVLILQDFREQIEQAERNQALLEQLTLWIGAIVIVMVVILIITNFANSIQRKIPEIGVLEAFGASRFFVIALYMLEAVTVTCFAIGISWFLNYMISQFILESLVDAFVNRDDLRHTILLSLENATVEPMRWTIALTGISLAIITTGITAWLVLKISIAEKVRER